MITIVNAYICPVCKNVIYSRARHDFRWCSCKEIAIDGGFDYHKVSYMNQPPKSVTVSIDATKEELYDDWNEKIDKYGIIGGKDMAFRSAKKYVGYDDNENNTKFEKELSEMEYLNEEDVTTIEDEEKKINNLILEINLNNPSCFSYIPIKSKLTKKELIDSFLIKLEYSMDKKIKIFSFCGYNFKTLYHTTPDGKIIELSIPIYDIDEWFDRFGNKI